MTTTTDVTRPQISQEQIARAFDLLKQHSESRLEQKGYGGFLLGLQNILV